MISVLRVIVKSKVKIQKSKGELKGRDMHWQAALFLNFYF
jgi:hypothetical protein